jgi:hypothetical protein
MTDKPIKNAPASVRQHLDILAVYDRRSYLFY